VTSSYSSGDNIAGLIVIEDTSKRRKSTSGVIKNFMIADRERRFPNFNITLFKSLPVTNFVDNAPQSIDDDDLPLILFNHNITGDNAFVTNGMIRGQAADRIGFRIESGTKLYAVLTLTSNETFTNTDALQLTVLYDENEL